MTTRHYGSCLCGAVRFEVEGSFECFFLCHCSFCRKDTGSRADWDHDLEAVPMIDRLPS
jgi:hypothetical protein